MKVSTIKEQGNKVIESISEPASPSEGTLWLDLNNTNIHPVINSGNLVEQKIITSDCSSVTFTGLDSLEDGDYILEIDGRGSAAATTALSAYINDDETETNYTHVNISVTSSNTTPSGSTENNAKVGAIRQNGYSFNRIVFSCGNSKVVIRGEETSDDNTSIISNIKCVKKNTPTTKITKIKIYASSGATIIGTGSIFRLYKSNAAQQLVPYNPIDISSRTSDYYLKPGEIVYIDFTNATTAPLNIATVEGEYELTIIGNGTNTTYTASPTYLRPNNTTYGNAFSYLEYGKEISTSDAGGSKTLDSYGTGSHPAIQIAYQQLLKANFFITTHTVAKCVIGSYIRKSSATTHVFNRNQVIWEDTTTAWTSLGTIVFPFTHSGKIIIKRII